MPNLFTWDIDAAVARYRDHLGFSVVGQAPADGRPEHVVFRLGDSKLAVSTRSAVAMVGLDAAAGHPFELIVGCDDVDRDTARLRAAGAFVVVERTTTSAATGGPTSPIRTATGSRSSTFAELAPRRWSPQLPLNVSATRVRRPGPAS